MTTTQLTAPITEIFSSLQGEGPRVGERQIFVRFRDCNARCSYCDELKREAVDYDAESLLAEVKRLDKEQGPHRVVSLTGGEPLCYASFLKELTPRLVAEGFQLYLETNGILHEQLDAILPWVSFVAMDIKLPSVTHDRDYRAEHEQFLLKCRSVESFVKIVVSHEIDFDELSRSLNIVHRVHPETLVVLQPMSASGTVWTDPEIDFLQQVQHFCLNIVPNVRVISRLHQLMGIR